MMQTTRTTAIFQQKMEKSQAGKTGCIQRLSEQPNTNDVSFPRGSVLASFSRCDILFPQHLFSTITPGTLKYGAMD